MNEGLDRNGLGLPAVAQTQSSRALRQWLRLTNHNESPESFSDGDVHFALRRTRKVASWTT